MIFEIEKIPEGGLNFDVLEGKEHFEIDQSDCALTDGVKVCGKLTKIEQEVCFSGNVEAVSKILFKKINLQFKEIKEMNAITDIKQLDEYDYVFFLRLCFLLRLLF